MTAAHEMPLNVALAQPRGVQNWLALLTFAMGVGGPGSSLFSTQQEIAKVEAKSPAIVTAPIWHTMTATYWTIAILAAAVSMFGAWMLLKTIDKSTPWKVTACLWISGPIASAIQWIAICAVFKLPPFPVQPSVTSTIVASAAICAAWTWYLQVSVRVKNTYWYPATIA